MRRNGLRGRLACGGAAAALAWGILAAGFGWEGDVEPDWLNINSYLVGICLEGHQAVSRSHVRPKTPIVIETDLQNGSRAGGYSKFPRLWSTLRE